MTLLKADTEHIGHFIPHFYRDATTILSSSYVEPKGAFLTDDNLAFEYFYPVFHVDFTAKVMFKVLKDPLSYAVFMASGCICRRQKQENGYFLLDAVWRVNSKGKLIRDKVALKKALGV